MLVCQASPSLILQKESKSWLDVLSECQLWRTSHCSLISTPCPALTTGLPTILFLITSSGQSHKPNPTTLSGMERVWLARLC